MRRRGAGLRAAALALALLALLALLAAGCGTADGGSPGREAAGGDAAQAASEPGASGAAAAEPAAAELAAPGVAREPAQPSPPPERTTYEVDVVFRPDERRLEGVTTAIVRNDVASPTGEARLLAHLNAFEGDAVAASDPVLPEFRERAYPDDFAGGGLTVLRASANGRPVSFDARGTSIALALPDAWEPGEWLRLELAWEARLPNVRHRFGADGGAYWFGNALPTMAVFDGVWRDYAYEPVGDPFYTTVADYRVRVTAPSEFEIVATGDETAVPADGGLTVTTVDAPRVRDFAFAATSEHRLLQAASAGGARVNVYVRKTSEARAKAALRDAAGMLDYLETRVGDYPYGELDLFENEMFVTGMEYPGLVFVRADRLNEEAGRETVVHEVAHQWFYNVVGNDQVAEPWLDEGFATYMTDAYLLGGRLDAEYERRLARLGGNARIGPVTDYDRWSDYWRGNYRKGALLLHALRGELGAETFDAFLRSYYDAFRYGVATTAGFAAAAEAAAGRELDEWFASWLGDQFAVGASP
ncbi:M1 family metallopeptidase [Paenibacillus sp.]|uniref:M1 family metallopeptidase n=1 Tax=Paenibacillus sp. TaxID=58172 RepID=UPI002D50DEE9|nr:M1 family metallopeptidase [Paenibacillus sp.]HZG88038.1 M1 family metallopeptidase [Paenibacillus sp.]